ncbi:MAG: YtxH domain-containing protein [Chloroflexi bacterium]|nr:YtxH domain-containing protein [Chloroflexota bacterium]
MAGEHSGPGFGTGLLLGSIIGALAGLLLAPRPGGETRQQVMGRAAGLRERAEELAGEARERIREAVEEGRAVAERIMGGSRGDRQQEGEPEHERREEGL